MCSTITSKISKKLIVWIYKLIWNSSRTHIELLLVLGTENKLSASAIYFFHLDTELNSFLGLAACLCLDQSVTTRWRGLLVRSGSWDNFWNLRIDQSHPNLSGDLKMCYLPHESWGKKSWAFSAYTFQKYCILIE